MEVIECYYDNGLELATSIAIHLNDMTYSF